MKKFARKLTQTFELDKAATWKGKKRDEGNGGADGMLVSMTMVGDGLYSACVLWAYLYILHIFNESLDPSNNCGSTEFTPSQSLLVPTTSRLGCRLIQAHLIWCVLFDFVANTIERFSQWIASTSCSSAPAREMV